MEHQAPNKSTSLRFAVVLMLGMCFVGATAKADSYIDGLRDSPETILFRAYDSQAEIDADINASDPDNRVNPPVFDSAQNAARWTFSGAGISIKDQLRPVFPEVSTGNLLFVWEARWDSAFLEDLGGLKTQKAFQLSNGKLRITEIRTRFSQSSSSEVALLDARGYSTWDPSGQPLEGQINSFAIQGANWTRFWAYVDFANQQFSMWVADEDTAPVQLFDQLQYSSMSGGLDNFWFEFNSSQSRSGGPLNVWGRNLIVMQDVSNIEDLVALGAPLRPMPMDDLSAN